MRTVRHVAAAAALALALGTTALDATPGFAQAAQPSPAQAGPAQPGQARERPLPGRHIEGRIAFLRTELKITDAQQAQWERVAAAMRSSASQMDKLALEGRAQRDKPSTAADQIERRAQHAAARAASTQAMAAAFKPLYGTLSEDQRKAADELFARRHGRRGR